MKDIAIPPRGPERTSAPFRFVSTWTTTAPPAQVWDRLADAGSWSRWWPGVRASEVIRRGDAAGVGERIALAVRSPLGLTLRFGVEILDARPPHTARARVVGDLRGRGSWTAQETGEGTRMTILWEVSSHLRWIRASRPVAGWAHAIVMAAGERRLRATLAGGSR